MIKSYDLLLLTVLLLLSACQKQDETPGTCTVPETLDYYQLKVGNYWVYDWSLANSPDFELIYRFTDTVSITEQTNIGGKEYFHFERSENALLPESVFLRDSLGFLIDENSLIHFTNAVFDTDVRVDSFANAQIWVVYQLASMEEAIITPVGTFPCLDFNGEVFFSEPGDNDGKKMHHYRTAGIGEVKQILHFALNPAYYESALVDYHLE